MSRLSRARARTHEVFELSRAHDALGRFVDVGLMVLVAGNVLAVMLESVPSLGAAYRDLFDAFENVSVAAFSAEFALRLWSASEVEGPGSPWRLRLRYLRTPMALTDFAAIAPFYLSSFFALDLRFLRVLRLLRVLKLTRYSGAFSMLGQAIVQERRAFGAAFTMLLIVLVFASSAMYVVEHRAQPEDFGSIPSSMWWAVVTLTTVGYGDVTPVTVLGKVLASLITIVGVGMVALPTSILASGLSDVHARHRRRLEAEADLALEDGIVDENEARSYAELAARLGVDEVAAEEVLSMARMAAEEALSEDCPHCGKSLY